MNRNGRKFRYRDRVNVQYDASADGIVDPDWRNKYVGIPCRVVDVSGMSSYRGVQLEETISTVVEMFKLKNLTPDMRIVYGKRTLNIKAAKLWRNGTAREKHMLMCTEVVV